LVNDIYEYSQANGYKFYCLTSSTDQETQDYWRDHTGAEYPFYESDETELKMVVRTSPGLLLIKDGVIIGKWSNYMMPTEERLNGRLEDLPIGQLHDVEGRKLLDWLLYFLMPLILIILIDRIGSGFSWYRHWRQKSRKLQLEKIQEQISNQIK
jgi:triosephosphate isomerase